MIETNRINKAKADIKRAWKSKNGWSIEMETLEICLHLLENVTNEK